jgi:phosphatidate cytidylyltransferase
MRRVLTALVLAAFALTCIFAAPDPVLFAVVALVACLCYREFSRIAAATGIQGRLEAGFVAGLIAMLWPVSLPLIGLALLTIALRSRDLNKAMGFAGAVTLAILYIFIPWKQAYLLRAVNPFWLFFALSLNWIGDVAAFYAGRRFGRNKLAPRVSPGKSWEGAIASIFGTVLYGIALGEFAGLGRPLWEMAILSAVANVAGQVGDLAESALKRGGGVKDSGTLLPGHGGLLDRVDSSLFTIPVVYYWLRWVSGVIAGSSADC